MPSLKNFANYLPFIILIIFFIIQWYFFSAHTQSFYFEDETEHLTPAWMMLNFHKELYADLSTNHQPLPILSSVIFLKVIPFNTLFMLIERLRQSLFFLSFLGGLLLTLRFRTKGLIASILIESIKFYLFGFHLLAESLVIYPLMYLAGISVNRNYLSNDKLIVPLLVFFIIFSLLPAAPFAIACFLYYLLSSSSKERYTSILIFMIAGLSLFLVIHPLAWFEETIKNNWLYFLPYENNTNLLNALIIPLKAIKYLPQPLPLYSLTLFLLFLANLKRQYFLLVLLLSLNLRNPQINVSFYQAFHLLPYLAVLTIFAIALIKNIKFRHIFIIILLLTFNLQWYGDPVDKTNEHFIQYNDQQRIGNAIKSIKHPTDTLLVGPLHGYINMIAETPLYDRQNAHLPWAWRSIQLREQFINATNQQLPVFIYFPDSTNPYYEYIQPLLTTKYTPILKDNQTIGLYIYSPEISKHPTNQLSQLGFDLGAN